MKLDRRQFFQLAAAASSIPSTSLFARADGYPTRPIHLIAAFPPGGVVDLFARLLAQPLSERVGQAVVVENRAGAGGNIGTEAVVRSAPDGYTLLLFNSSNTWNATLYEKLNFDVLRDIVPVASINRGMAVLVVHPSLAVRTIPEFIDYAKERPGKVIMASGGIGSTQHVYGELFKRTAGIDLLHVPYRGGGPALLDLLSGRVPVMFDTLATSMEYIREGRLRALGVTAAVRSMALPDIPSIGEFLPGFEGTGWQGIAAPRNTSVEVLERLNAQINACIAEPKFQTRTVELGYSVFSSSRAEFSRFVAEYTGKWAKIIRAANIKID